MPGPATLALSVAVMGIRLLGGATTGTPGESKVAINPVVIPYDPSLQLSALTLECFMRIDALPTGSDYLPITGRGLYGQGNENFQLALGPNPGKLGYLYAPLSGAGEEIVDGATTLTRRRWYATALTIDGSTGEIYGYVAARRDGSLPAATSYTIDAHAVVGAGIDVTDLARLIFGAGEVPGSKLYGAAQVSLSEIRLTGSVLSLATLNARLGSRLSPDDAAACIGYWPCDENGDSVDTVYDVSRHGLDGVFARNPLWTDDPPDLYYQFQLNNPAFGYPVGDTVGSSITASSAQTDYPVTRLRSPRQADTTRTADASTTRRWTRYTGGGRPAIRAVSMHGFNWTSKATILLEAGDADSWGAPPFSEHVRFHPRQIIHLLALPLEYDWWRLSVTDTTNPDGYLEAGVWQLWELNEMTQGLPIAGLADQDIDPSVAVMTQHGDIVSRELGRVREISFPVYGQRRHVAERQYELFRDLASGAPILVLPQPWDQLYRASVYGYPVAMPTLKLSATGLHADIEGIQVVADHPGRVSP
jgi:hypothetical protein